MPKNVVGGKEKMRTFDKQFIYMFFSFFSFVSSIACMILGTIFQFVIQIKRFGFIAKTIFIPHWSGWLILIGVCLLIISMCFGSKIKL